MRRAKRWEPVLSASLLVIFVGLKGVYQVGGHSVCEMPFARLEASYSSIIPPIFNSRPH